MFRKLTEILSKRYGNDNLNLFLLVLMVIVAVINIFARLRFLSLIQSAFFVLFILRFLSSNHYARRNENEKFMRIYNKIFKKNTSDEFNTVFTNDFKYNPKKEKGFKYFKCPNCSAKLRVPKNKGKITITCPKCRHSFKGKS